MFGRTSSELVANLAHVSEYAETQLAIRFHPKKTYINKVEHGLNFVGYILLPHRRYLRRSILSSLMQKLENEQFMQDADVPASVNSYLGMLRHVNGWKGRGKVCQRLNWLGYQSDPKRTKVFV
jgi:hypothetical protein